MWVIILTLSRRIFEFSSVSIYASPGKFFLLIWVGGVSNTGEFVGGSVILGEKESDLKRNGARVHLWTSKTFRQ